MPSRGRHRRLVALALLLAAGCSQATAPTPAATPAAAPSPSTDPSPPTEAPDPVPTPSPTETAPPSPVAQLVAGMTDEELAGQLLMVSVYGSDADEVLPAFAEANRDLYGVDTPAAVIELLRPAGIILIGSNPQDAGRGQWRTGNTQDPTAVPGLVAGLQAAAPTPLLVAIDQEHGPVARLGPPFTRFPSAMALGAAADPSLAREVAAAAARELAAAGINVNLAPVADVNTEPTNPVIGVRSLGELPGPSADLVVAQIHGIQQDAGIAATAKHFPGHGDTTLDSHDALPTVTTTLAELQAGALRPFAAAVDAEVELIMPGHLLVPAVDPTRPATLSSALLRDLLRDEMGFEGIVVTDSMWMGAIRSGDDARTAVDALAAGADLVLMPPDAVGTLGAIVDAMAAGVLDRAAVEQSVSRILDLKWRLGLLEAASPSPSLPSAADQARHSELATTAAARAVTLLDGSCPPPLRDAAVSVEGDQAAQVAALLAADGVTVEPTADRRVVLWAGRGGAPSADGDVVVVLGSPYAAGRVQGAGSLLVTYGDTDAALRGLATALADGTFTGRTPVTIPRVDRPALPAGTGVACPAAPD